MNTTLLKQCVAEFIGTFALIFIGLGAIYHDAGLLAIALAHGLTIAVMVSATGAISGGHLNPARTFGPALASGHWNNPLIYWLRPLLGGGLAGLVYGRFLLKQSPS